MIKTYEGIAFEEFIHKRYALQSEQLKIHIFVSKQFLVFTHFLSTQQTYGSEKDKIQDHPSVLNWTQSS